jgi:hypothetical protein
MKTAIALAIVLALGAAAQAKLAPVGPQIGPPKLDPMAIMIGPAYATIEHNYFRQPPQPLAARRIFPCTVQAIVFEKIRLAQYCD